MFLRKVFNHCHTNTVMTVLSVFNPNHRFLSKKLFCKNVKCLLLKKIVKSLNIRGQNKNWFALFKMHDSHDDRRPIFRSSFQVNSTY